MKTRKASRPARARVNTPAAPAVGRSVLRLFVAGATDRSRLAILSVRQLCAAAREVRCKLEVIDIYQQPSLARAYQIVATPTLLRELPLPARRYIGNFTHLTGLFAESEPVLVVTPSLENHAT